MEEHPEDFLKQKYWGSQEFREAAKKTADRTKVREGTRIPNEPTALIENYLRRFTEIFEREDEDEREQGIKALKRLLHRKFIVKPENVSDEYIKGVLFGNFAKQKGYTRRDLRDPSIKQRILEQFKVETGHSFEEYVVPEEEKERVREMAINDQETRLDSWLNYLTSKEAVQNIPAAYRYWVFAEMLKLGSYDDERRVYNVRTSDTAAPFPELDQQALALVLDEIRKKQRGEVSGLILRDEKEAEEFRKRLQGENFGKLYAFVQEHLKSLRLPTERLIITDGEWRVFPKGSDAKEVVKALEGFHTQWCIAGEGTARDYLKHSDLHIYFSQDKDNKNTIPRACIVTSEDGITEVRGIISNDVAKQHLDDYITPVVDKYLGFLPGGEKWRNQMQDMRRLAVIHIKHLQGEEFSKDDLRFLYEIEHKIQSTGYDRDPRIQDIIGKRNIKDDLSFILDIPKEQISTTKEEALSGNIKYHYGDLDLSSFISAKGLNLPEEVGGNLYLTDLTSADGLNFPRKLGGSLYLSYLNSVKGLNLPEEVGGNLDLRFLRSADGLKLPRKVGGNLNLANITSADRLVSPDEVGGNIYLSSLDSADDLKLPRKVGGNLYLANITSAKGLKLPEEVDGVIYLGSFKSAEKDELRKKYPSLRIIFSLLI